MLTKRHLDFAAYVIFIALIMMAPLVMDEFWLNRVAKYLVFGVVILVIILKPKGLFSYKGR